MSYRGDEVGGYSSYISIMVLCAIFFVMIGKKRNSLALSTTLSFIITYVLIELIHPKNLSSMRDSIVMTCLTAVVYIFLPDENIKK